MKKSLIFVGMLAIGFANAQEGNVGINTDQPKATLDIQPNATNLAGTTNEGILAPRLSKTRIANIEANKLTEGTLVYATDDATSPISAYAGTDTKVAKITEKGYYFYNGTEWVKAGTDVTSQIWQKQPDKSILLVDNNIENTIKYSSTGNYINIPKTLRQISSWNNGVQTGVYNPNETNNGNSAILNISYADKIREDFLDPIYKEKYLNLNHLIVDGQSNSSRLDRFFTQKNILQTNEDYTKNIPSLYAGVNSAEHYGTGRISFALMGAYNVGVLGNGSASRIVGAYNQATSRVSTDLPTMEGTYSFVTPRGSGNINSIYGTRNHLHLTKDSTNSINTVALNRNHAEIIGGFTGTIENLYGSSTYFETPLAYTGIKNLYGIRVTGAVKGQESNYGLYIGNVGNTTAQNNYSIYTETGKVRVGDLADTGATTDRVVTVDANGVLKAGGTIAANNGVQTQSSMTCTAENAGKINYTTIQKDGKDTGVFGFCMQKGTDYVWAYMLGGSNIYGTSANGAAFGDGL